MLLIPAIDLRGGRCVRLYQGDFAAETRYEYSPPELLEKYRRLGASWVHVVDLDGARDGVLANREVIIELAALRGLRLQVGGGIRSPEVIEDLISSGVERVVVGSAAVERPDDVIDWASRFGADFYGLPHNEGTVTLERADTEVPAGYPYGDDTLVPLRAGERLRWRVRDAAPASA